VQSGKDPTIRVNCTIEKCSVPLCDAGHYLEVVLETENDCCPQEICIPINCSLQTPPKCGPNQELKSVSEDKICPQLACRKKKILV